jgi:gamma-butyrobetaine dioxygenase
MEHTTFEVSPFDNSLDPSNPPRLFAVNYSPPFQAPLPPSTPSHVMEQLREALHVFDRISSSDEMLFEIQLGEGDCVVVSLDSHLSLFDLPLAKRVASKV